MSYVRSWLIFVKPNSRGANKSARAAAARDGALFLLSLATRFPIPPRTSFVSRPFPTDTAVFPIRSLAPILRRFDRERGSQESRRGPFQPLSTTIGNRRNAYAIVRTGILGSINRGAPLIRAADFRLTGITKLFSGEDPRRRRSSRGSRFGKTN